MRRILPLALLVLLAACGGGAAELLETARLEETQNNRPHARALYEQILREHPASTEAQVARERLAALATQP